MGLGSGMGSSRGKKSYAVDSLGAIFNVPAQTHTVGREYGHHITVQYGGGRFSCHRNDDASARSIYTIDSDDDDKEYVASPGSGISRGLRGSSASLLSQLNRGRSTKKCLKMKKVSKGYRSWLPAWGKTDVTRGSQRALSPSPTVSKRLSLYKPLQSKKRSGNKLKRKSGPIGKDYMPCQPRIALPQSHGTYYYPSSTIYAPQIMAQNMGYFAGAHTMLPTCSYYNSSLHASHPVGPTQQAQLPIATAGRIRAIQQSIDSAAAKLKQDSSNLALQNEMAQLKAKLNIMLDSAVKRATPLTQQKQTSTKLRQDDTRGLFEPKPVDTPKPPRAAIADVDKEELKDAPRNATESHISAEHTCSSCGTPRSKSFHAIHPYAPGQKPVHNVCRACRANYEDVGVMRRYHFCYSCGIVRSKTYQRRHAYEDPSLHTRNFCSKCAKYCDPKPTSRIRLPSMSPNDNEESVAESKTGIDKNNSDSKSTVSEQFTAPQDTTPDDKLPPRSPYLPSRRIGSALRRAERLGPEADLLSKSLHLDGSPGMKHYQPPSVETISPTREESAENQNDTIEPCPATSPTDANHQLDTTHRPKDVKSSLQTSPLISPPLPRPETARLSYDDKEQPQTSTSEDATDKNQSTDTFRSSSGAFDKRRTTSPKSAHWPKLDNPVPNNHDTNITVDDSTRSPATEDEQPRFSKGAFGKLPSTLPPSPNPHSPIQTTYTDPSFSSSPTSSSSSSSSAPGNTYYQPRTKAPAPSSYLNQTSIFESYGTSSSEHLHHHPQHHQPSTSGTFEATRGAWSVNNPRSSWLRNEGGGSEQVPPEPIIEEPVSPVLSAVRTPLLLEFDVSDLSQSANSLNLDEMAVNERERW